MRRFEHFENRVRERLEPLTGTGTTGCGSSLKFQRSIRSVARADQRRKSVCHHAKTLGLQSIACHPEGLTAFSSKAFDQAVRCWCNLCWPKGGFVVGGRNRRHPAGWVCSEYRFCDRVASSRLTNRFSRGHGAQIVVPSCRCDLANPVCLARTPVATNPCVVPV